MSLNKWELDFLPETEKDFDKLDGSLQKVVEKAIKKVRQNPYPPEKGGYGKPLGNKHGMNLAGFYKIKLKSSGIRVVYQLIETKTSMLVVVIGARADDSVYEVAQQRIEKYGLK